MRTVYMVATTRLFKAMPDDLGFERVRSEHLQRNRVPTNFGRTFVLGSPSASSP
jgi:hypothetical protein